jgi:nucleolar MIF4G domain-containing protein 1
MSYRGSRGGRGGKPSGPQLPTALLAEVDPSGGRLTLCTYADLSASTNRNRGRPRGALANRQRGPQREDVKASLKKFNSSRQSREAVSARPDPVPPRVKRAKIERPEEAPKKRKKKELSLPGAKADDAEDGEIAWLEYMLRKEQRKEEDTIDDGLDG